MTRCGRLPGATVQVLEQHRPLQRPVPHRRRCSSASIGRTSAVCAMLIFR